MSDLYSASSNPPRRAKRLLVAELPTYPSHPSTTDSLMQTIPDLVPPVPAKRGRKPGPLSRSAREAQRRLNHSIIEKARRTKINDALATLRQLVPVDYGFKTESREDEEDDDDDEYPEDAKRSKSKSKSKGTGKREEKEKEFKLEILVRTVSFLQDLLKRVETMETSALVCQHCGAACQPCDKKRKHSQIYDHDDDHQAPPSKVARSPEVHPRQIFNSHSISPVSTPELQPSGARLPPISSWLPHADIDPTLLSPQNKPVAQPKTIPYLPSPPSSTHFDPVRTSQVPPVLNLGPVATAAMVAPPHTSEDESAASLLLQIAASPPFRPSMPASSINSNYNLPDPSKFSLHSDSRSRRSGDHVRQPETPRSLLGLHHEQKYK